MPCLRAYAPSGIRTPDLLIASQEYEPLHHSEKNNLGVATVTERLCNKGEHSSESREEEMHINENLNYYALSVIMNVGHPTHLTLP